MALTPSLAQDRIIDSRAVVPRKAHRCLLERFRPALLLDSTKATAGDSMPATLSFALSLHLPFEPMPSQSR